MEEFNNETYTEDSVIVDEPSDENGAADKTASASAADKPQKDWSVATLVMGIISIVFAWFGYGAIVGLIAGIIGVVFAKKCKDAGISNGKKTAGLILSIIGIIGGAITFVSCVFCAGIFSCAALAG